MAKKKKEVLCQGCLKSSADKNVQKEVFFIVDHENHYSVHCIDCISKWNLKIVRPYFKTKKEKTDE